MPDDSYVSSIKNAVKRHAVLYSEAQSADKARQMEIGMAYINGMYAVCQWLCRNDGELSAQRMTKILQELFAELGFQIETIPLT